MNIWIGIVSYRFVLLPSVCEGENSFSFLFFFAFFFQFWRAWRVENNNIGLIAWTRENEKKMRIIKSLIRNVTVQKRNRESDHCINTMMIEFRFKDEHSFSYCRRFVSIHVSLFYLSIHPFAFSLSLSSVLSLCPGIFDSFDDGLLSSENTLFSIFRCIESILNREIRYTKSQIWTRHRWNSYSCLCSFWWTMFIHHHVCIQTTHSSYETFVCLFCLVLKRGNEVFKLLKETKEKVKHGTRKFRIRIQ